MSPTPLLTIDVAHVLLDARSLFEADRRAGGSAFPDLVAWLGREPHLVERACVAAGQACERVVQSPVDLPADVVVRDVQVHVAWTTLHAALSLLEQTVHGGDAPWAAYGGEDEDDPKTYRAGYLDLMERARRLAEHMVTPSWQRASGRDDGPTGPPQA